MTELLAYVDESERPGRYLMSCVVIDRADAGRARSAARGLLLPGQRRLRFHSESDRRQRSLVADLLAIDVGASVFVCRSAPGRRTAQARAACLAAIVVDLQSTGEPVRLTLESRHNQDADDHPVIWAARRPTPPLTYEHVSGAGEPLLWLADAYAWLVGAGGDWQRRLGNSVRVIDVG